MDDKRHQKRVELFQALYAATFHSGSLAQTLEENAETSTLTQLLKSLAEIDAKISLYAPERPLPEINKVDLAILRMIVFESTYKKTPAKVLVNEGVELAKTFGSENSPKFVNGVLASMLLDGPTANEDLASAQ